MKVRILQSSDWHLGSGVLPSNHRFGKNIQKIREEEEKLFLDKIIDTAIAEGVELVLLPGDLWDAEVISPSIGQRVIDSLMKLGTIPVIIVPGNHDFLGKDSLYDSGTSARFGLTWPENVHIVKSKSFESFNIPQLPYVSITAEATGVNVPISERLLDKPLPIGPEDLNILLFHGSHETGRMKGSTDTQLFTAPFTSDELLKQEFDYTALGHYHKDNFFKDDSGKIRAAYSGAPFQRSFQERDRSGVLVFDLEPGGVSEKSMKFIEIDTRQYNTVTVRLSSEDEEVAIEKKVANELQRIKCAPEDLVRVKFEGSYDTGNLWRPDLDLGNMVAGWEYNTSRLESSFNYNEALKEAPKGSIQGVFLERMKNLLDDTSDPDAENNTKRMLEMAIRFGYFALKGRQPDIQVEPFVIEEKE